MKRKFYKFQCKILQKKVSIGKGREGKGRERKGRDGKEREGKGREGLRTKIQGKGRVRKIRRVRVKGREGSGPRREGKGRLTKIFKSLNSILNHMNIKFILLILNFYIG